MSADAQFALIATVFLVVCVVGILLKRPRRVPIESNEDRFSPEQQLREETQRLVDHARIRELSRRDSLDLPAAAELHALLLWDLEEARENVRFLKKALRKQPDLALPVSRAEERERRLEHDLRLLKEALAHLGPRGGLPNKRLKLTPPVLYGSLPFVTTTARRRSLAAIR